MFLLAGTGVVAVLKSSKVAVAGIATVKVKVNPAKVIQYFLLPN